MKILELGWGDLSEVNLQKGDITTVAKKIVGKPAKHVTAIEGDFFDMQFHKDFDRINANYSLCFNSKEIIEDRLPFILECLKKGGILTISDFQRSEQIVLKRTNLDSDWFFDILKRNINPEISILRKDIFEEVHNHSHSIFVIKVVKI
jgi:SAM-dependent methyltransferase